MAIYMREDLIQKNEKEDNVKNSNNINHDVVTKPNVVHGQQLKQDSKQQRNKGGAYKTRKGTSLNGAINYLSMPEENYHDIL